MDIKDTLNRIKHVGNLISLNEDSNYAKIANALLSTGRARLDVAVEATKKNLGDWAGTELDNWWGTILSIERLPGVESAEDFVGDATYVSRIKRFMEAGNKGISLEALRMAAEAGAGVPFRIDKAENRIILTPLEELSPANRAGALRAAYRVSPARAVVEIGNAESYSSSPFTRVWSDSVYVGEDPSNVRMDGPNWDSENMMIVASANKWGVAPEGTLGPGSGLPNLLMRGGVWHVPSLGFGEKATLTLGTEADEAINRVKFTLGGGSWRILGSVDDQDVFLEDVTGNSWQTFDTVFVFSKGSSVRFEFTNIAQEERSLFVKGAYVGARVDSGNKESWIALGGDKGAGERGNVVISDASSILAGGEWVCTPAPDPSFEKSLYLQVGGVPQKVSSLNFKTRTPGSLFRIAYSMDDLEEEQKYPDLKWTDIPTYYKLNNGRVDVEPFKAKHLRLTFTNLRPMLLKEYYSEN